MGTSFLPGCVRLLSVSAWMMPIILVAACTTVPSAHDGSTFPADGECAERTEIVDGFAVTIVGPKRPRPTQAQPYFRPAAYHEEIGQIIALSPRLRKAALALMQDRSLGAFIRQMARDPVVSYHLLEAKVHRNGGGRTTHCNYDRFDIYIDLEYHLSTEGTACTNPRDSGSLQSLLAHELGHAWVWRWYGLDAKCDNNALGNKISVAWENTQLKGAQRRVHDLPGCGCANIK